MEPFENLVLLDSKLKMPLMKLPVRSVAIKLASGSVLVSPGSNLSIEQLKSVDQVHEIVANNGFHSGGMAQARKVFPAARVWGVPGFNHPHTLNELSWPHRAEMPLVVLEGIPRIAEAVFIHRQSKTLICADLCFNLTALKGLGPWIILNLFGTYGRFAVSKFFLRFVKDKKAFENSQGRIFSHDFDNILMGHGEAMVGGARERLIQAFAERGLKPT